MTEFLSILGLSFFFILLVWCVSYRWWIHGSVSEFPTTGIIEVPSETDYLLINVTCWDANGLVQDVALLLKQGKINKIYTDPYPQIDTKNLEVIDCSGKFVMPGLVDSHVHMMYDSGPDLLTNGSALVKTWLSEIEQFTNRGYVSSPIVRRGKQRLLAGVTSMRILGDGYYSLQYRDEINAGTIIGPKILTAGLHVNGVDGYISSGFGQMTGPTEIETSVELASLAEIESKMEQHIARGIDVIKVSATHGDMGFQDAEPDLSEEYLTEIVSIAHRAGLKITCHSYGATGDLAAVQAGVDSIEHLVNVPHALAPELIDQIVKKGIQVCPTLSGSSYSILKLLNDPGILHRDDDLRQHLPSSFRRSLYRALRILKLPGFTRMVFKKKNAFQKWQTWYEYSIENTKALKDAGVELIFGTDVPFTFGNFWHTVSNEFEAWELVGFTPEEILSIATHTTAMAIGMNKTGLIQPGYAADLLILEQNPLSDLTAFNPIKVFVNGRMVVDKESVL